MLDQQNLGRSIGKQQICKIKTNKLSRGQGINISDKKLLNYWWISPKYACILVAVAKYEQKFFPEGIGFIPQILLPWLILILVLDYLYLYINVLKFYVSLFRSYEKEEMEEFILHLLVLSHVFMVPHLKRECELMLELGFLTIDNVVDVFQLALLCDVPRLSLICHRKILKNFKAASESEGWKAMKESHPDLEKELLESMIEEENVRLVFFILRPRNFD